MSKKLILSFIFVILLIAIVSVVGTLFYLKSMSFTPSTLGNAANSHISYVVPANWQTTQQAGDYSSQNSWGSKEYLQIQSPDKSKNDTHCGIICGDNITPNGTFEIGTYDTHQLSDVKEWYAARLQSHTIANGPKTTYRTTTIDNQPAYCARYNDGLYSEACFVVWHDAVYGISINSKTFGDYVIEKLIRSSITFH